MLIKKVHVRTIIKKLPESGWGGEIRTPECQDQNLVPYHLATPQSYVCCDMYCDTAK